MKLGLYIMPPGNISAAYFVNPPAININTAASQTVEVIILIFT
jgi:hypothetical protein